MPFACPLPFTRRVGQASVARHASRLTEPWHLPHPARLVHVAIPHVPLEKPGRSATPAPTDAPPAEPFRLRGGRTSHFSSTLPPDHAPGRGKQSRRNIRWRLRATRPDAPTLKEVLLSAAEKGAAPPLHVDAVDISVTDSHAFDWAISVNEHYARLHNDSDLTPASVEQGDAALAKRKGAPALQQLLATLISRMVNQPARLTSSQADSFVVDLSSADEALLLDQGYDASDLLNWATILTTIDSVDAVRLLTGRAGPPESLVDDHNTTPAFVYLYLLRRRHISPEALRMLVTHLPAWLQKATSSATQLDHLDQDMFRDSPYAQTTQSQGRVHPRSLQSHVFRACVRLFRHARLVWPDSLPAIAEYLTTFLRMSPRAETALLDGFVPSESLARLTLLFNRALHLISNPAAVEPFKSVMHQEAAQAVILRHMAEHDPPLVINRAGYRAVARVQLTQPKTDTETEWARLKSPSWPPWKEDRTGMDANVGLEYGVSRARHVLNRMQEAGYAMQTWESVALIYAGWDSDLSPTIQTRAIMPDDNSRIAHQVWAARIRSTRTVEQAWACFLSCEDQRSTLNQDVYLAMFEKLVEERKRHRLDDAHPTQLASSTRGTTGLLPGDAKEVFPPPQSLHQATYTKTPPPTVQHLHARMLQHKITPSGRTLAFLMNNAESLKEGLDYLRSSEGSYPDIVDKLAYHMNRFDDLKHVPDSVFAAAITLFMRFPHTPLASLVAGTAIKRTGKHKLDDVTELDLRQPLSRAFYLLDTDRRQYLPSWNAILKGLARRRAPVVWSTWTNSARRVERGLEPSVTSRNETYDRVVAFHLAVRILKVMRETDLKLDGAAFVQFCIITQNAAVAAADVLESIALRPKELDNATTPTSSRVTKARDVRESVRFVRDQFWTLVGHASTSAPSTTSTLRLPRLLTTPSPAILHAYIRALGLLQDYDGLLELVSWMREYRSEIEVRKDVDNNGATVFRRCIVALRVFLEGRWQAEFRPDVEVVDEGSHDEQDIDEIDDKRPGSGVDESVQVGAPREMLDQVWDTVDEVEDWGGWASEEEATMYVQRMKDV